MSRETPAYIIGHITVKDEELFAEYRAQVPGTIAPWGGELIFRGSKRCVLSGAHDHNDLPLVNYYDPTPINTGLNRLENNLAILFKRKNKTIKLPPDGSDKGW